MPKTIFSSAIAGMVLVGGVSAQTLEYSYDDLGRLIAVDYDAQAEVSYKYDAAGNRTSVCVTGSDGVEDCGEGASSDQRFRFEHYNFSLLTSSMSTWRAGWEFKIFDSQNGGQQVDFDDPAYANMTVKAVMGGVEHEVVQLETLNTAWYKYDSWALVGGVATSAQAALESRLIFYADGDIGAGDSSANDLQLQIDHYLVDPDGDAGPIEPEVYVAEVCNRTVLRHTNWAVSDRNAVKLRREYQDCQGSVPQPGDSDLRYSIDLQPFTYIAPGNPGRWRAAWMIQLLDRANAGSLVEADASTSLTVKFSDETVQQVDWLEFETSSAWQNVVDANDGDSSTALVEDMFLPRQVVEYSANAGPGAVQIKEITFNGETHLVSNLSPCGIVLSEPSEPAAQAAGSYTEKDCGDDAGQDGSGDGDDQGGSGGVGVPTTLAIVPFSYRPANTSAGWRAAWEVTVYDSAGNVLGQDDGVSGQVTVSRTSGNTTEDLSWLSGVASAWHDPSVPATDELLVYSVEDYSPSSDGVVTLAEITIGGVTFNATGADSAIMLDPCLMSVSEPSGNDPQTVRIPKDCGAGDAVYAFASSSLTLDESSTQDASVTVTRSGGDMSQVAVVDVSFHYNSSASSGDILGAPTVESLTFGPGEGSKSLPIRAVSDEYSEGLESFELRLENPSVGSVLSAEDTVTVEIQDDFVFPTFEIVDAPTVSEEDYLLFTVRQTDGRGLRARVTVRTEDGTAVKGDDYVEVVGFPFDTDGHSQDGGYERTVFVYPVRDSVDEADGKSVKLVIDSVEHIYTDDSGQLAIGEVRNPSGVIGTGVINDNDPPATFSILASSPSVMPGQTATFEVTRMGRTEFDYTLNAVVDTGGTTLAVSDLSKSSQTFNFVGSPSDVGPIDVSFTFDVTIDPAAAIGYGDIESLVVDLVAAPGSQPVPSITAPTSLIAVVGDNQTTGPGQPTDDLIPFEACEPLALAENIRSNDGGGSDAWALTEVTPRPAWLGLDAQTGELSGVAPSMPGVYAFQYELSDPTEGKSVPATVKVEVISKSGEGFVHDPDDTGSAEAYAPYTGTCGGN